VTERRFLILIGAVVLAIAIGRVSFVGAQSLLFATDQDQGARLRELKERQLGSRVATLPSQGGRPEVGLYVARLADGSICVSSASADKTSAGGGCNSASAPLNGKPFIAIFAYDGGPAVATVEDARLYGLADRSVEELRLEMSDDSTRQLHLSAHAVAATPYRVFAYRVSHADIRARITPVAVVAYDASGAVIGRQPTGLPAES
jgi:hypothetical protein